MTSETIELPPGGSDHDSPRHDPPSSSGASGEPRPPGELTSGNDELSGLLSESATKPDRLPGPYSTEEPSSAKPPPPAPEAPVVKLEPEEQEPEPFDAVAALNAFLSTTPGVPVTASTAPSAVAVEPLLVSLDSSPEIPSLPKPPLVDVTAAASSPGSFKAFPALDLGAPSPTRPGSNRRRRRSRRRKTRSMMRTSPRAGRHGRSFCFSAMQVPSRSA